MRRFRARSRRARIEGRRDESTVDNSVSKPQNPAHWGPREGAATCMSSLGVPLLTAKTWGRWSVSGQTYETTYAHPAPATLGARRLFGWLLPDWQLQYPGALPLRL